jgi:acyl-CoA synthetase (NDP forming)
VGGFATRASILDVPGDVDLAVVAVPAPAVARVVEECGEKGVRGIVVLSAGFREVGAEGATVEEGLRRTARRYGMRLVGPNCIGVLNTATGLDATFTPYIPSAGAVAMQSQSGAVGIALLELVSRVGLSVSSVVSAGNQADVSTNDLLQYWEDDPATRVVLLYLESFGNPAKFARIARRVSRRKPIVAVKSGRSEAGARAAGSHTAAMTTSDASVDALFRQAGVIRVNRLDELFDMAVLLAHQPLPRGRRLAIVGNSGGPGVLAADACAAAVQRAGAGAEKPVIACFLAWPGMPTLVRGPEGPAVPAVDSPEAAVGCLVRVVGYHDWLRPEPGTVPVLPDVDDQGARTIVEAALAEDPAGGWLQPAEVSALLDAYGVDVVPTRAASGAANAVAAAHEVGWPVALKAVGPDRRNPPGGGGTLGERDRSGRTAGSSRPRP